MFLNKEKSCQLENGLMLPLMTFEVFVHLMKNIFLYNVVIHTKFSSDQILDKKDI